jgi:hypothetical protein
VTSLGIMESCSSNGVSGPGAVGCDAVKCCVSIPTFHAEDGGIGVLPRIYMA